MKQIRWGLLGASGHARVIIDMLHSTEQNVPVCLFDDDSRKVGTFFEDVPVVGPIAALHEMLPELDSVVVCIGDNKVRRKIVESLGLQSVPYDSVVHPSAVIAKGVEIGAGTVVMPGSVINPGTVVGRHSIINTRASVDHDCMIADFVHVAPGATLCGNVTLEEGAMAGAGSTVIPGCTLGEWSLLGAGGAAVCSLPSGLTYGGVPAIRIGRKA